jgi:hypothetical protein
VASTFAGRAIVVVVVVVELVVVELVNAISPGTVDVVESRTRIVVAVAPFDPEPTSFGENAIPIST